MKLEEKILALRKQYGMSQEELAGKLNVSRQAISRWEMGTAQPDVSNILQLSKVFCVTTDYLLNDECEQEIHRSEKETGKGATKKTQQKKIGILILLFGLLGNFVIYIFSRFIKVMIPYITEVDGRRVYEWGETYRVKLLLFCTTIQLRVFEHFVLSVYCGGNRYFLYG